MILLQLLQLTASLTIIIGTFWKASLFQKRSFGKDADLVFLLFVGFLAFLLFVDGFITGILVNNSTTLSEALQGEGLLFQALIFLAVCRLISSRHGNGRDPHPTGREPIPIRPKQSSSSTTTKQGKRAA